MLVTPPFGASSNIALWRAYSKPPVELVVIMDGRYIGTCVLPEAQVKIYLRASVATRAKRRYDELTAKGTQCNLEEIEKDIEDRDYRDMHRETSPLKQAKDAVLVDSSEMNIDEVVDAIYQIYARV